MHIADAGRVSELQGQPVRPGSPSAAPGSEQHPAASSCMPLGHYNSKLDLLVRTSWGPRDLIVHTYSSSLHSFRSCTQQSTAQISTWHMESAQRRKQDDSTEKKNFIIKIITKTQIKDCDQCRIQNWLGPNLHKAWRPFVKKSTPDGS